MSGLNGTVVIQGAQAPAPAPSADPNAGLVAQVQAAISTAVQGAVAPLQARLDATDAQLQQLNGTRSQSGAKPSQLFGGGAPAIRQGEDPLTSRGYSFARMLFCLDPRNHGAMDQAKVEIDIHNKLHQVYGGALGQGTILAPLGGYHLQAADSRLAAECSQLVRQGVTPGGFDPAELQWRVAQAMIQGAIRQDFSLVTDDTGGILLGPTSQGEMIDLLRNKEIFSRAGASEITLPPNGRIQWPRHKTAGAGYWVGEGQAISESDMTFGNLVMQAKKLGALLDLPNEMFRFVTMAIEAFVRNEIAKTLALKLDSSSYNAVGSAVEVKGLLAYSGINTYTASTVGTDGNTLEPEDINKMVATVEEDNIDVTNFTFVMRPLMWAGVKNRRADAVTAADKKGAYLFNTADGRLNGSRVITTAAVPNNITKGSGTTLTQVLGGVFSEWLIGRVGAIEFALDPYAGTAGTNFKNDMTSIRAIQHVDAIPRREEAFVYCTELING